MKSLEELMVLPEKTLETITHELTGRKPKKGLKKEVLAKLAFDAQMNGVMQEESAKNEAAGVEVIKKPDSVMAGHEDIKTALAGIDMDFHIDGDVIEFRKGAKVQCTTVHQPLNTIVKTARIFAR